MSTFNMVGGGSGMLTLSDRRRMRRPLATAPAGSVARKPRYLAPDGTPDFTPANTPVVVADSAPDVNVAPVREAPGRRLVQVAGQEDDSGILGGPSVVYPEMGDRMGPPQPVVGPPAPIAMGYVHNPTTHENIDIVRTSPMSVSEGVDKGLVQIVPRGQDGYAPNAATLRIAGEMRDANENSAVGRAADYMMEQNNATRFERWRGGPTSVNNRRASAVLDHIEQIRLGRDQAQLQVDTTKQMEEIKTEESRQRPQMQGAGNSVIGWDPNAAGGSGGYVVSSGAAGGQPPKTMAEMDIKDLMDLKQKVVNDSNIPKEKDLGIGTQLEIAELRKQGKHKEAEELLNKQGGLSPAQQAFVDSIDAELERREGGSTERRDKSKNSRDWRSKVGA